MKERLTLFACPKPMTDPHIAMIQRNAIRSWLQLDPLPEIILFGGEVGVAELSRELGVGHVAKVERNEYGTPLVNSIFAQAEACSQSDVLCYINADIILMSDFMSVLTSTRYSLKKFMLGARPWNLDVKESLTFSSDWDVELREQVKARGQLRNVWACDFFAYPRRMWGTLPPLILGRCGFDNALMWLARSRGFALVDGTSGIVSVHQNHSYPSHLQNEMYIKNPEAQMNIEAAGGMEKLFNWGNASHAWDGIRVARMWTRLLQSSPRFYRAQRVYDDYIWYPALKATRPLRSLWRQQNQ